MLTDFAKDERRLAIAAAAVLASILGAVALGRPGHSSLLPPCPFHALTGYFCPGCGSTRALYLLVHGHLAAALGENALAMLLLPLVVYELVAILTRKFPALSARAHPRLIWGLLALVLAFTLLRNLPISPFSLLAPVDLP
jgi:hypothetical protein